MDFTLWYRGPLRSDGNAQHKHEIRTELSSQIEALWMEHGNPRCVSLDQDAQTALPDHHDQARRDRAVRGYQNLIKDVLVRERGTYRFIPLLQQEPSFYPEHILSVQLSITLMRTGPPGAIIQGGDIDNRLKTLFDALHPPQHAPDQAGKTVWCLLADDEQISSVNVTTRQLWNPTNEEEVVLLIDVHPQSFTPGGLGPVLNHASLGV